MGYLELAPLPLTELLSCLLGLLDSVAWEPAVEKREGGGKEEGKGGGRDGGMEGWREGGMEGGRDGGREGWREGWREGGREDGKEGRREEESDGEGGKSNLAPPTFCYTLHAQKRRTNLYSTGKNIHLSVLDEVDRES